MNATRLDWFGVATIAVWAALLWRTLRATTTTKAGSALKAVVLVLLIGFGAMMLWNSTARMF